MTLGSTSLAGAPDRVRLRTLRVKRGIFVNYCYAVVDTSTLDALLVDPAWQPDVIDRVLDLDGAKVQGIALTHSHPDHVDLANALSRRHRCAVYMSKEEIDCYRFRCARLESFRSCDVLQAGSLTIESIETPGHTKGSVCYRLGDDVLTGDTLFAEGCGICAGPGADAGALFDSIQTLKRILPAHARVHPGHSFGKPPGLTFGELHGINVYLAFERRESFVDFRMRKNQPRWMNFT